MKKTSLLPIPLALMMLPALAFGAENTPALLQKHYIKNAIQVKLTPRGLNLFKDNMGLVANNMGISYKEFYMPEISWTSKSSYKLDELNLSTENKKLVQSIQTLLSSWFAGLKINEMQPSIQVKGFDAKLEFNRFSITTDEALLKKLNKTTGIILVLEADVKNVDVSVDEVRAQNLKTAKLGKVGIDGFQIKAADGAKSLKVKIPIYMKINDHQIPEFEAVGLEQNFNQIDISESHQKLIVPSIQLVINGQVFNLNNAQVDRQFKAAIPTLIAQLRGYLSTLAQEQLPAFLNQTSKDFISGTFEQATPLPAPGAPEGDANPLLIGLQLTEVTQLNGVNFLMNSYIEDMTNTSSRPPEINRAIQESSYSRIPLHEYDLGLSVNLSLINRALQLSFERGLFKNVGGGTSKKKYDYCHGPKKADEDNNSAGIELTEPPQLVELDWSKTPFPARGETFARVHASFKTSYSKKMIIGADIILKIKKANKGREFSIYLWDLDEESLTINGKKHNILNKIVIPTLGVAIPSLDLPQMVADWRCNETTVAENITLPAFSGIPTVIEHLSMENSGHLFLFLNYDLTNNTGVK